MLICFKNTFLRVLISNISYLIMYKEFLRLFIRVRSETCFKDSSVIEYTIWSMKSISSWKDCITLMSNRNLLLLNQESTLSTKKYWSL